MTVDIGLVSAEMFRVPVSIQGHNRLKGRKRADQITSGVVTMGEGTRVGR